MAGWFCVILRVGSPTCLWIRFQKDAQEKGAGWRLDLYTTDQESEVRRLMEIGATRYPWRHRPGDDFVVLADPDDNLFCVVQVK